MIKALLATTIAILWSCLMTVAQNHKVDEHNGFRDAKLGMPISEIPGLVISSYQYTSDGELKLYSRPSDKLSIGPYKLSRIEYMSYRGLLHSIRISTVTLTDANGVRAVFGEEYGHPQKETTAYGLEATWIGDNVIINMSGMQMGKSYIGLTYIVSTPISTQMGYDKKTAIKSATSDL